RCRVRRTLPPFMLSHRSFATVLAATLLACGGSSTDSVAPPEDLTPATLVATSPTNANGTVGAALASPLSVKITTKAGRVLPNVAVTFRVTQGGGSVSPSSVTSDAQGIATTTIPSR